MIPIGSDVLGMVLKDWRNWKSAEEVRPSNLQHCRNRPEY